MGKGSSQSDEKLLAAGAKSQKAVGGNGQRLSQRGRQGGAQSTSPAQAQLQFGIELARQGRQIKGFGHGKFSWFRRQKACSRAGRNRHQKNNICPKPPLLRLPEQVGPRQGARRTAVPALPALSDRDCEECRQGNPSRPGRAPGRRRIALTQERRPFFCNKQKLQTKRDHAAFTCQDIIRTI